MNRAETPSGMPRKTVGQRDSQAWRSTLDAAQRVMGYYAAKAEGSAVLRNQPEAASAIRVDRATAPRLAA